MEMINITNVKTSSDGAWQGDNPLNYAFPLLIIQTTLVLFVTRFLAFLLKPLRQPKVIAEILGGILLGPSALGRNKDFVEWVFPSWSTPILESVASIGLLFFLFLVGLELDFSSIRRSGKHAFSIALAGISLPFLLGVGVTFLLRKVVKGEEKVGYSQCLLFMGVAFSITAFPVLARILAELKLLTTQVGETAMAAAAFNDVVAWILLALAVALAGGNQKSPLVSIWVLVSGVGFVVFMFVFVRPMMNWVAKHCSSQQNFVDEAYICLTLAGVMLSGFMTDLIGIHSIFGAFIFGLIIPKGGEFSGSLITRIEDFVSGLLLPLYFASSGLKTDVAKISGLQAWSLLGLVISTACAGKILGTFLAALLCTIPVRESLALAVLMNTKGLVELIVLNIGKEKKVLNEEMFAILVLMALFTTFITTPAVMIIYKRPSSLITSRFRHPSESNQSESSNSLTNNLKPYNLRILACIHGSRDVPSLIKLIDSIRSNQSSSLKLYVMHLVELTDRSSSIMMVQKARKNGVPFTRCFNRGALNDQVTTAFKSYEGQVGHARIRHSTAISALSSMHEDICQMAEAKRVSLIVLPFHKKWRRDQMGEKEMEVLGYGWRGVNQRVLTNSACSVVIFVDRGFGAEPKQGNDQIIVANYGVKRVCILFVGGADDREALKMGEMMAQNPTVSVTVVRLLYNTEQGDDPSSSTLNHNRDKEVDETTMEEFKQRWNGTVECIEKVVRGNIAETVLAMGKSKEYELMILGKGQYPPSVLTILGPHHHIEHVELGPIGDTLASSQNGINPSLIVIRHPHHQPAVNGNESTTTKCGDPSSINARESAV